MSKGFKLRADYREWCKISAPHGRDAIAMHERNKPNPLPSWLGDSVT
ncbi:MAG: hypothetical protein F6K21_28470 [Symploca sp. SIO2D2]|nr:hypothetical protein [Symploca sp. SIO2D2]